MSGVSAVVPELNLKFVVALVTKTPDTPLNNAEFALEGTNVTNGVLS